MVGSPSSTENREEIFGAVAQLQQDGRLRREVEATIPDEANRYEEDEDFGDPYPPRANASSEQKLEYFRAVSDYSKEMLGCLQGFTDLKGEELWIEYTCSFRKATIKALTKTQQMDWARFLRSRGVFVRHEGGISTVGRLYKIALKRRNLCQPLNMTKK